MTLLQLPAADRSAPGAHRSAQRHAWRTHACRCLRRFYLFCCVISLLPVPFVATEHNFAILLAAAAADVTIDPTALSPASAAPPSLPLSFVY
jgi:hypothetical protein